VVAWEGDTGSPPSTLAAEGSASDLDEDLLALVGHIRDGRHELAAGLARSRAPAPLRLLIRLFGRFLSLDEVRDVHEGVSVETDVDEAGIHAWEDALDASLVDATDLDGVAFDA